jgi:hypothetical protein
MAIQDRSGGCIVLLRNPLQRNVLGVSESLPPNRRVLGGNGRSNLHEDVERNGTRRVIDSPLVEGAS